MKTKIIIGIVCFLIAGFVSCSKEESEIIELKPQEETDPEPRTDIEPSDAVKEYFGYEASIINRLELLGIENTKSGKSAKMEKLEEVCIEVEYTPENPVDGVIDEALFTFLPCAPIDGWMKIALHNNIFSRSMDICLKIDDAPYRCCNLYLESGLNEDLTEFESLEMLKTYDSKPELNIVYDHLYSSSRMIDVTITIAGKEEQRRTSVSFLKHSGSLFISRGDISYNNTLKSTIKYAYIGENYDEDPLVNGGDLTDPNWSNRRLYVETILVEGIEEVKYKRGDKEGVFLIDYGQGEVDTKATITENGEVYEIDYQKLREEMGQLVD